MAAPFDLSQTDRLLTTTRSVRKRLDLARPVARETILECLQIATQAPSGSNSQPWRFLVIEDPAVKSEIATLYRKSHDPHVEAAREAAGHAGIGAKGERIASSSHHLADHLEEVPALVIPCLLKRLPAEADVAETAGFYGSILPAVWSFMLALRSRGIGSAWTTLHLVYESEAASILRIPPTVTQVALIPVAHYTGTDFKPADRRPAEEVVYWDLWKQQTPTTD